MTATAPLAAPIGVLLAAGHSRRMGRPKQLLPWPPPDGPSTVVAASYDLIAPFCRSVLVVVGASPQPVLTALGARPHRPVAGRPDDALLDSIRAGLRAAEADATGCPVLLHLADHPATRPETVGALLEAAAIDPSRAVLPEHGGRGGHPVLLPAALIDSIVEWTGGDGLAGFMRAHPSLVQRLPVDDPQSTRDLDTPEDYDGFASG